MAWRPARSLEILKSQLDEAYPGWLFLGFLGDAAHASVPSDHNPNAAGVVTALDIGPGGGLAIHELANRLAASPHPDLKYIISNRRIAEWQNGFKWQPYGGSDPHDTHIHVSVGRGPDGRSAPPYDDTNKWNIKGDEVLDLNAARLLVRLAFYHEPADDSFTSKLVGKDIFEAIKMIEATPERKNMTNLINSKSTPPDATVLKPGVYKVN